MASHPGKSESHAIVELELCCADLLHSVEVSGSFCQYALLQAM